MKRVEFVLLLLGALAAASATAGPVNINTADAVTLAEELNGVGPALARAIVEDRAKNGSFARPEDLMRVSGIGMRIIENNRAFILVADSESVN
jgi:competence protein ComEA